ncbi:hypothetical protein G8T60_12010 [Clostridium botulinum C]|uniref:Transposase n=1 Tax=Clostridium haemolyticum NCTC 9693 TaxID=1443114 RepID=A0ABR4THU0_CLOHA|nr:MULTISPECIES: hypothetical protein [Clostridium]KEI18221.1 hypothetical protein Z960_03575 [Clostridium haemolyticum NCTC 9693]KGN02922.1 hypothetical protein Z961_07830 [Clostridium haemolyticum NCTC 8350]MCD3206794.1 hypothetical protein [Clostridium botulinum C]MCD3209551.1 hypothetical protein [Clostridium botulinum C]MCD3226594.1 hypothetical protein [Clostridium botulinum C]
MIKYRNWKDVKDNSYYKMNAKKYCNLGKEILKEQRKGSKRNKKRIKELIDIRKSIMEHI